MLPLCFTIVKLYSCQLYISWFKRLQSWREHIQPVIYTTLKFFLFASSSTNFLLMANIELCITRDPFQLSIGEWQPISTVHVLIEILWALKALISEHSGMPCQFYAFPETRNAVNLRPQLFFFWASTQNNPSACDKFFFWLRSKQGRVYWIFRFAVLPKLWVVIRTACCLYDGAIRFGEFYHLSGPGATLAFLPAFTGKFCFELSRGTQYFNGKLFLCQRKQRMTMHLEKTRVQQF